MEIFCDAPDAPIEVAPEPEEAPAWETCKENAKPLRRGRNATALAARLEEGPTATSAEEEQAANSAVAAAKIKRRLVHPRPHQKAIREVVDG